MVDDVGERGVAAVVDAAGRVDAARDRLQEAAVEGAHDVLTVAPSAFLCRSWADRKSTACPTRVSSGTETATSTCLDCPWCNEPRAMPRVVGVLANTSCGSPPSNLTVPSSACRLSTADVPTVVAVLARA